VSSTCFEHPSVFPQDDLYLKFLGVSFMQTFKHLGFVNLSDSTSNLFRQYAFPVLPRCRKTSDMVFVSFVGPVSEPVRLFSLCSTDCSQQIAQVVLFLFIHDFFNCRIITSNPPTSLPHKTNKSWGVCGWQNNLTGNG
jgi:hypothetical protein